MSTRYLQKDKLGNEWMTIAQFVRAIMDDFDVKISNTLVSSAKKNGKLHEKYRKRKLGKNCINYTQAVIPFLEVHPNIAPANFKLLAKEWRNKLPKEAKATIKAPLDSTSSDSDDEEFDDLSVAIEKAKHEKIKREKAEFEFEIFKGNYIHIDDVAQVLQTIAIETRQAVKAVIPRVATILAAADTPHKVRQILEDDTDVALNSLERLDDILDGSFQEKEQKKQLEEEEGPKK